MLRETVFLFVLLCSLAIAKDQQAIIQSLDNYNKAFGEGNYSKIINAFDLPAVFILNDKTITASGNFKLKLIYKKIRGDLPDYYAYSKWDDINIEILDDKIAIANASYSRYNSDGEIFFTGSAQYHLRLKDNEWKIFALTPFETIKKLPKNE